MPHTDTTDTGQRVVRFVRSETSNRPGFQPVEGEVEQATIHGLARILATEGYNPVLGGTATISRSERGINHVVTVLNTDNEPDPDAVVDICHRMIEREWLSRTRVVVHACTNCDDPELWVSVDGTRYGCMRCGQEDTPRRYPIGG